jgi:cyclic pyranopterin monophosphate synthase
LSRVVTICQRTGACLKLERPPSTPQAKGGSSFAYDIVTACRCGVRPGPAVHASAAADRLRSVTQSGDLTHVDEAGAARMVDVSAKEPTLRRAVAAGRVETTPEVIALLRRDGLPKGDALAVARIGGIMGAKRTPDLVPLCHPIALHGVTVDLDVRESTVEITAIVRTADRTGVEMEALTAVATAGLALIDMVKAVDPAASIEGVRVLRKEGGKTGDWVRPEDRP